jgi:hypothetical protein
MLVSGEKGIAPELHTMSHSDYRTLINHGRKAGLRTSEMYSAMSARAPEASDLANGQSDGNGYAAGYANGRRVYQPVRGPQQS